jgi:hypothetical protein
MGRCDRRRRRFRRSGASDRDRLYSDQPPSSSTGCPIHYWRLSGDWRFRGYGIPKRSPQVWPWWLGRLGHDHGNNIAWLAPRPASSWRGMANHFRRDQHRAARCRTRASLARIVLVYANAPNRPGEAKFQEMTSVLKNEADSERPGCKQQTAWRPLLRRRDYSTRWGVLGTSSTWLQQEIFRLTVLPPFDRFVTPPEGKVGTCAARPTAPSVAPDSLCERMPESHSTGVQQ